MSNATLFWRAKMCKVTRANHDVSTSVSSAAAEAEAKAEAKAAAAGDSVVSGKRGRREEWLAPNGVTLIFVGAFEFSQCFGQGTVVQVVII